MRTDSGVKRAVVCLVLPAALLSVAFWLMASGRRDDVEASLIPLQGFGDIRFGCTSGEVKAILGEARSVGPTGNLIYPDRGLVFYFGRHGSLEAIEATGPPVNLAMRASYSGNVLGRLRLGSDLQTARDVLGEPSHLKMSGRQPNNATWKNLGIRIHFNDEGRAANIYVSGAAITIE